MDSARHRRLYGTLDLLAIAPFIEEYGDRLSPEGRRLARQLDRALRGESPLARHIRVELTALLRARQHGQGDDIAWQRLIALLVRYARRRRREGICGRLQWTTPNSRGSITRWT